MDNAFFLWGGGGRGTISWERGILSLGGDAHQPYWLRFSTMIILEHLPVVNCPEKNPPPPHTHTAWKPWDGIAPTKILFENLMGGGPWLWKPCVNITVL